MKEGVDGFHQALEVRQDGALLLEAERGQGVGNPPRDHIRNGVLFPVLLQVYTQPGRVIKGGIRRVGLSDGDLGQPQNGREDQVRLLAREDAMLGEGYMSAAKVVPRHPRHEVNETDIEAFRPGHERPKMEEGREKVRRLRLRLGGRRGTGGQHRIERASNDVGI